MNTLKTNLFTGRFTNDWESELQFMMLVHFFLYDMPSKVMVWEELLYASIFHIKNVRIKILLFFFLSMQKVKFTLEWIK